jgi:hypothetical protein
LSVQVGVTAVHGEPPHTPTDAPPTADTHLSNDLKGDSIPAEFAN